MKDIVQKLERFSSDLHTLYNAKVNALLHRRIKMILNRLSEMGRREDRSNFSRFQCFCKVLCLRNCVKPNHRAVRTETMKSLAAC